MEITRCDFCSESSCEFCHQNIHKLSNSQKEFVNKIKADAIDEFIQKCKDGFIFCNGRDVIKQIERVAEQLKQRNNE